MRAARQLLRSFKPGPPGRHISVVVLLLALLAGQGLSAQEDLVPVPELTGRVVDTVSLLDPGSRQAIDSYLEGLEERKGSQVVVLIVESTGPEPIEEFSIRVAEAWQIGRGDVDDGVILVVARSDRRMRIEVGYGLEGAIPDITAKRIIADIMAPHFREQDFGGGIQAGVEAIGARIEGEPLPEPSATTDSRDQEGGEFFFLACFVIALIASALLRMASTGKRLLGSGILAFLCFLMALFFFAFFTALTYAFVIFCVAAFGHNFRGRGGGSVFSGSGGGFGGSFGGGGFSGGGGSFGGGGASGSW